MVCRFVLDFLWNIEQRRKPKEESYLGTRFQNQKCKYPNCHTLSSLLSGVRSVLHSPVLKLSPPSQKSKSRFSSISNNNTRILERSIPIIWLYPNHNQFYARSPRNEGILPTRSKMNKKAGLFRSSFWQSMHLSVSNKCWGVLLNYAQKPKYTEHCAQNVKVRNNQSNPVILLERDDGQVDEFMAIDSLGCGFAYPSILNRDQKMHEKAAKRKENVQSIKANFCANIWSSNTGWKYAESWRQKSQITETWQNNQHF